jgi:hypothetical protein
VKERRKKKKREGWRGVCFGEKERLSVGDAQMCFCGPFL